MQEIQQEMINTRQLATMINMSISWVYLNRKRIVSGQKIGGKWQFSASTIKAKIACGLPIIIKR